MDEINAANSRQLQGTLIIDIRSEPQMDYSEFGVGIKVHYSVW